MNAHDKDRKKEWKLAQKQQARAAFPMSDAMLESLFDSVDARIKDSGCDHTLRFTEAWLTEHHQSVTSVLGWLNEHGAYCDCEVLANAVDHWEQNREMEAL
ncbi:MAG TPA: DUF2695 domain-containing protein [Fluviicoccus sp.]|nr:DUF2695 domain-containing protein [Fluviicoccus sp.]